MKMMVRRSLPLLGLVVVMLGMAHLGWAQTTTGNSSGQVSEVLSFNLYCQVISLLEGYIGLLLGLIMLVAGFWTLIKGGSVPVALSMILMGGLVTALPSLINSTLNGTYLLLEQAQMIGKSTFSPPVCSINNLNGNIYNNGQVTNVQSDGQNIYVTGTGGLTTSFGM